MFVSPIVLSIPPLTTSFDKNHYSLEVMLGYVRYCVAYPLSLRHARKMVQERSVFIPPPRITGQQKCCVVAYRFRAAQTSRS